MVIAIGTLIFGFAAGWYAKGKIGVKVALDAAALEDIAKKL